MFKLLSLSQMVLQRCESVPFVWKSHLYLFPRTLREATFYQKRLHVLPSHPTSERRVTVSNHLMLLNTFLSTGIRRPGLCPFLTFINGNGTSMIWLICAAISTESWFKRSNPQTTTDLPRASSSSSLAYGFLTLTTSSTSASSAETLFHR